MIDEGNDLESARSLIPPRPNLGPEPWGDEGGPGPGTLIGIGAGLALVALIVGRGWIRARRRKAARDRDAPAAADRPPTDPRIAASEAARSALVRAFGPSWRSKTTEEIAADPGLRDRLGPDRLADLIALFLRADRAKFAADHASEPGEGEEDSIARGLAAIEALEVEPAPRKPTGP